LRYYNLLADDIVTLEVLSQKKVLLQTTSSASSITQSCYIILSMIFTPLIHKSIDFAIQVHEIDTKKKRKGKDIPYITHPLTVGLILARVTQDENIIAAGILHDTIEDCEPYGSVTKNLIAREFNGEIAQMVNDVTEQDKTLPWMERKMAALKHIQDMGHNSLLVKSADTLHNLTELNDDISTNGEVVFSKFNATKNDTVTRYKKLIPEIKRSWSDNPLLTDLEYGLIRLLKLTD